MQDIQHRDKCRQVVNKWYVSYVGDQTEEDETVMDGGKREAHEQNNEIFTNHPQKNYKAYRDP